MVVVGTVRVVLVAERVRVTRPATLDGIDSVTGLETVTWDEIAIVMVIGIAPIELGPAVEMTTGTVTAVVVAIGATISNSNSNNSSRIKVDNRRVVAGLQVPVGRLSRL